MTIQRKHRDEITGRLISDEPPELFVEIIIVEGVEGKRLAHEQAQILWEVAQWQGQNKFVSGLKDAA